MAAFLALASALCLAVLAVLLRPLWRDARGLAVGIGVVVLASGALLYRIVGTPAALDARAVQPHVEAEPEHEAARRLGDRELGRHLLRHGQIALAAELERLELDRERLAVLLTGAETQPAERKAGHGASVALVNSL